jgi:negative regulator of flagellin synthesis FlgM
MDIRNSLEGLKSLLGATPTAPAGTQQARSGAAPAGGPLGADSATLSSAGSEVAQAAAESGVRMDKVTSIQALLAAGTYNVSASAVASRVVDSMLGAQQ